MAAIHAALTKLVLAPGKAHELSQKMTNIEGLLSSKTKKLLLTDPNHAEIIHDVNFINDLAASLVEQVTLYRHDTGLALQ